MKTKTGENKLGKQKQQVMANYYVKNNTIKPKRKDIRAKQNMGTNFDRGLNIHT